MRYPGTIEFAEMYYEQQAAILLEMILERAMNMRHDYCTRKDIDATVAIRNLIEKNPQHLYTTDQLSKYTCLNVSRLHKRFKELHGTTLYDLGQGVRLEHAQHLLRNTQQTLQEIAEQCGYNERSNITAAFIKRFGYSPTQFRASR